MITAKLLFIAIGIVVYALGVIASLSISKYLFKAQGYRYITWESDGKPWRVLAFFSWLGVVIQVPLLLDTYFTKIFSGK